MDTLRTALLSPGRKPACRRRGRLEACLAWKSRPHATDGGVGSSRHRPMKHIEGEVYVGISLQLKELLERHDGLSRSVPSRNGTLIAHDTSDDETNGNSGGGLH